MNSTVSRSMRANRKAWPSMVLSLVLVAAFVLVSPLGINLTNGAPLQATNVSGVVNTYYDVVIVSPASITLGAATAGAGHTLAAGDCAVLIEMTGSNMGVYEVLDVASVSGSTVTFASGPARTYGAGEIQLVHMPCDPTGLTVTGAVNAAIWDGNLGGVVALGGGGALTLNDNIDVSGAGFSIDNGPGVGSEGAVPTHSEIFPTSSTISARRINGAGGGGGIIGGGGAGGGAWDPSIQATAGTAATATSHGVGAALLDANGNQVGIYGTNGGAAGGIGNGSSSPVAGGQIGISAESQKFPGVGGGGGGSYGGGAGSCGTYYASTYGAGGGGGGSYTGGGFGGKGGEGFGGTNDAVHEDGAAGNAALAADIPSASHYLHAGDARLMMGGAGGNSLNFNDNPRGGNGGGIILLDVASVNGANNAILANGAVGQQGSPLSAGQDYIGEPGYIGPTSGAGGGAGGQMYIAGTGHQDLFVLANGGAGGAGYADLYHAPQAGGSGGGGGIWFDGAGVENTNSGSGAGADAGASSVAAVGTNVFWSVAGGSGAAVPTTGITYEGTAYTMQQWTTLYNQAAAASIINSTTVGTELALLLNVSEATLIADYPNLFGIDNPKNLSYGCAPATGGTGLMRVSGILTGSLGDTVFHDADGDGVYDPAAGDLPLENVMLTLEYPDGTTVMTTTNAAGEYTFADLPLNATYTVTVDISSLPSTKDIAPTGDASNTADQTSEGTITLSTELTPENADDPMLDFGFQPLGSLGDTVFHDADGDGVYDPAAGDLPLENVMLTLEYPDGTTVMTTTNAAGEYTFADLPLNATYTVTVDTSSLPSTKDIAPTGDASNTADQTSEGTITLSTELTPANANDPMLDFGFQPLGSLGDTVFHDADGDGVYDPAAGDLPLENVMLTLEYPDGTTVMTTTNAAGEYTFAELPLNATYTVTVDTSSLPSTKDIAPTGDASNTADQTSEGTITLSTELTPANANDPMLDFGFQPLGSLGDTVFHDADGDGVYDPAAGDLPLENVMLTLEYPDGTTVMTTTNAAGEYTFADLPLNATYTVTVDTSSLPSTKDIAPTGDASNTADQTSEGTITLSTELTPANANDPMLDFGFQPLGSLGDTVFHDADGDGVYDPAAGDLPLENVMLTLEYPDGTTVMTTTNAAGEYTFAELPLNATYTVTVDTSSLPSTKDIAPTGDASNTADQTSEGTITLSTELTPANANDPMLDFGFQPLGSIGDTIWHDVNGDGVQDPGEDGIVGLTVTLIDSSGMTTTATTDGFGKYLFEELSMGDYTVVVDTSTLPADKLTTPTADPDGGADSTSMVTLTLDEPNDLNQDFAYEPVGSVGDLIYHDANGDGVMNTTDGDFPLENITVTLTDANGGTQTTTTDSSGNYLFANLPLGDYTVTVDTSGLVNKEAAPTADPDGGADSTSEVSLTPEEPNNSEQDFGYEPTPDAPTLGAIGDTIFHDANGDGVMNTADGDFPLENVTVTLTDAAGNSQMTTTDADGMYLFSSLPLGDYTVTVDTSTLPAGKVLDPTVDPDGGADSTSMVTLTEEEPVDLNEDFGYSPEALGSIGDTIYHDANGDGVMNTADGDFPLENVTVTLTDENGNSQTTTTNSSGMYLFENLPLDATYTVMVDTSSLVNKETAPSADPDGGADSVSEVTLTQAAPDDLDQDFGYEPTPGAPTLGAIGDTIFHDANGDGVMNPADGDFPLENVTVTLTDAAGNSQMAITDENGMYLFSSLPLGDYTVTVDTSTLPAGKVLDPTADPDGGADSTSMVTLTEEEPVDLNEDFGYSPEALGSIGDTIYHDANGDGVMNTADGDFPLENVTVTLTDENGNSQTTTTNSSGMYLFENLPLDATYTVMVDTSSLANKETAPSADPDGGADSVSEVTLTQAAPDDLDQDFGYEPTPGAPTLGAIGNTIFHDANGDGVMNPADGDFPLENVTVTLTGPNGSQNTITDENGMYLFSALPLGDYTITVDTATLPDGKQLDPTADPDGGADSTSMVTLTEETPVELDEDFGYSPEALGSIGDTIYHDANGDGVMNPADGDFPLENVTVTLTDENGNSQTTTTNSSGMYLFENLPLDATYTVMVDTSSLANKETAPSADPDGGADSVSEVTLTQAAPDDLDQDFGYEPTPGAPTLGAIGDTIFHDINGDGVMNPADGDFPLSGVTVTLSGPDGSQSATTDENGMYLFSSLPLGDYTVTVDTATLPDGKNISPSADPDGSADSTSSVRLTADVAVDLDQDFGYEPDGSLGSIGDTIYHDANGDGVMNPADGDFPLENVTVTLTDENGNSQTTTTNSSGMYLFENLPLDATYTVMVDTSSLANKETAPSADPDGGADSVSEVTLTQAAPDDLDQDFGYEPTPGAPTLGAIGDTIFHDINGDGVMNPADGDFPLSGVTVTLSGPDGSQSATTDENGMYLFSSLPLGDYTVTVDTATLPDGKNISPSADPDGSADSTSSVRLTADVAVDLDQDFGYEPDAVGSIGDTIFHDANGDGVFNEAAGDFPLPSVTVNLLNANGNVIATTQTDVNGSYLFDGLPMGDYSVMVDTSTLPTGKLASPSADPDGGADNVSVVTLTPANPDNREQGFGYEQDPTLASLGNYYWIDVDNDGIKDPDEAPVVGSVVTLYGTGGDVVATTATDVNGFFSFTVAPGTYSLGFELPTGYIFTEQNIRDGDGYNSDVDPSTGQTVSITLGPGRHDPSWGAGVILGAPTAVNLSDFTVELRNGNELVIRWTTTAEIDTAGFHILRSTDGSLANARQVTSQLTPSQGSSGGSYEVVLPYDETLDAPLSLYSFWLYEVESGGAINYYGPAMVDVDASQMDTFMFLPFLSQ